MAWFPNYKERRAWLERNGLPVIIQKARLGPDGFLALYLRADDAVLPRSNVSRGWDLRITLGYSSDYPEGVAELLCEHINAARAGRYYVLDIEWVGEGGAAMIRGSDPIAEDPLIHWLHRNGHYGNGRWVRPRQLHVSL